MPQSWVRWRGLACVLTACCLLNCVLARNTLSCAWMCFSFPPLHPPPHPSFPPLSPTPHPHVCSGPWCAETLLPHCPPTGAHSNSNTGSQGRCGNCVEPQGLRGLQANVQPPKSKVSAWNGEGQVGREQGIEDQGCSNFQEFWHSERM